MTTAADSEGTSCLRRIFSSPARSHGGSAISCAWAAPLPFWASSPASPGTTMAASAALAVLPRSAYVYFGLGVVRYQEDKLAEALACYRRAVELDPGYSAAHANLGLVLDRLKRPEEAKRSFRRAIELDPLNIYAHI